jgi:hypothetical protein
MELAMERRSNLAAMGLRGRAHVEQFANPSCMTALREWAL